jgi:hypothetical protein
LLKLHIKDMKGNSIMLASKRVENEYLQAEGPSKRDEPEDIREGQRAHAALDEEQ